MKIIYSSHYNIGLFGLENLHPFDSRKYGRAWTVLKGQFGDALAKYHVRVDGPVSDEGLLLAHTSEYLARLKSSRTLAAALEVPQLAFVPASMIQWRLLRPMRWAVQGSIQAGRCALESGLAINLAGGYHHAKPAEGEGFCVFSDAAVMVRQLRAEKRLTGPIAYVDLDAHQGNGVCYQFRDDPLVRIFDMYNKDIYPCSDFKAQDRIDCKIPLELNTTGAHYLRLLRNQLPGFLDGWQARPELCIYNAGTDPYAQDQLGGLCLSAADILERDLFVIDQARARGIPLVMVLSGGYSKESYKLVAATIARLLSRNSCAGRG